MARKQRLTAEQIEIQESPEFGYERLTQMIRENRLTHVGKEYAINVNSRIEVRICKVGSTKHEKPKPECICNSIEEINNARNVYPLQHRNGDAAYKWEYRVFTGNDDIGKAVNVWCAFTHASGFREKESVLKIPVLLPVSS